MKIALVFLFIAPFAISSKIDKDYSSIDSAPPEPNSRFAMLDDVRILANGLLQLGHGLKDFVHKTKGQMNDIFQKLNIFDKSFYELSLQTNEIKVEEEELRKTTSRLQANNEEIRNISLELNSKIEDLLQDKIQLQEKVGGLEEKVIKLVHIQPEVQEPKEMTSLKLSNTSFQENTESSFSLKQTEPKIIPLPSHNSTAPVQEFNGVATDCTALYKRGERTSGIYSIKPNGSEAFNVYCEMKSDSSWTVIQNRVDGSLDFNQTWESYANGFGDLKGEFWLGLAKLYSIANQADYILRIELKDWKDNKRYVEYTLTLGSPETDYTLHLSEISGNIPNALPEQTKLRFSMMDHDNATKRDFNCPERYSDFRVLRHHLSIIIPFHRCGKLKHRDAKWLVAQSVWGNQSEWKIYQTKIRRKTGKETRNILEASERKILFDQVNQTDDTSYGFRNF
ncbi:angiopoietin-related protein 3 isoform X3 [Terrapene carolina triunguis]|uniref:angiopoietin-related protein 3 isoform X3 n=1 Tax=Terrapene triunguis TaxID=2587831 RepID=UPI000E7761A1|nr:angiopoietin-related protein 3 isoform X3 [Terrapene carolina triunguis]